MENTMKFKPPLLQAIDKINLCVNVVSLLGPKSDGKLAEARLSGKERELYDAALDELKKQIGGES